MSLTSPVTMLLAWVIVPLLVAALSLGLGHGVQRLAGLRLGALSAPVGFLAAAGLASSLLKLGISGKLTVAIVVVLCVAGPLAAVAARARRRERPLARVRPGAAVLVPAAGAVAAYLIGIAPLVGAGRSGVVGYVLSNDPAVHLSVVALLIEHGAEVQPAVSSLESVSSLFESGYPLGSYVWPAVATVLTGVDAFHLWTPLIALSGGMTAAAAYAGLRMLGGGARVAAAAGALVAVGYLPYSTLAQGGAKEVMLATGVVTTVVAFAAALEQRVTLRTLLPAALAATGAMGVFGPGALAFLGPPALVAVLLGAVGRGNRARVRAGLGLAGAALFSFALAAPALVASTQFVNAAESDTRDPNEIGNLVGPVPVRETANVWLAADYRFPVPDEQLLTAVGTALALALAAGGVVWSLRRRSASVPLLLLGAAIASAYAESRYSAYFAAKAYVVLAVAVGLASAAGVVALLAHDRWRFVGVAAGVVLAAGVLASDVYVQRGAWMTPKQRFQELIDLGDRYAGRAPALVVEREDYAKYLLRDTKPFESFGFWQPDRGLLPSVLLDPFHTPDIDDYRLDFLARFQLMIERKRPGGSLPPSGFRLAEETEHYRVWERSGPLPAQRIPVRRDEYDSTAPLNCEDPGVAGLLDAAVRDGRPVRALLRDAGVRAAAASDWHWFTPNMEGPAPAYRVARAKSALADVRLEPGRYDVWIRGQIGPGVRVWVGDVTGRVGDVFGDLGQVDQWNRAGLATVAADGEPVMIGGLELPSWRTGSDRADVLGGIAFTPVGEQPRTVEVAPERARSLCGRTVDWVEVP